MIGLFGLPLIVIGVVVVTVALLFHHREKVEPPPADTRTAFEMAGIALAEGRSSAAEGYLRESIGRDEKKAESLLLLGEILARRGQYEAAILLLDQSMAIEPKAAQFFARGECLAALGRNGAAMADFEKAVAMAPSDSVFANKRYLFMIGQGLGEEVRKQVRSDLQVGLQAQTDHWLVATAALALQDGKESSAVLLLQAARDSMSPKDFNYLMADPVLQQYRGQPEVQRFFVSSEKVP